MLRLFLAGWLILSSSLVIAQASGEQYPSRPIKVIVPFGPGSTADVIARIFSDKVGQRLKQPLIIENRAGAGGTIGVAFVTKAPADGYTLLLTTSSPLTINPLVDKNVAYRVESELTPIAVLNSIGLMLVTSPNIPAKTLPELIAYLKKNPGKFSYGSSGVGSIHNLMMELIAEKAQIQINHIPYKGAAAAILDTLGGNINGYCGTISSQQEFVKKGDLKPLFVTSAKRSSYMPDVPTLAEAGLPPIVAGYWMGLSAPAGTPDAIINLLNKEVNVVLSDPANIKKLSVQAIDPIGGTPAEMDRFYESELKLWKSAVSAAKVEPIALNK